MGNRSNVIKFTDHSMNKIEERVNELLDKLEFIGSSEDIKTLKASIPIWVEITNLRGKQLQYMDSSNEKVRKAMDQALADLVEVRAIMADHEDRIMAVEENPMSDGLAQAFIAHMGLEAKFESFVESEIDRVMAESLKKQSDGSSGFH